MTDELEPAEVNSTKEKLKGPQKEPLSHSTRTEGLPVAAGFGAVLDQANVPQQSILVDKRIMLISALAVVLGIVCAYMSALLQNVIGFITTVSFYGHASFKAAPLIENHIGLWIIAVPVIGGLIVGLMARFGSEAIRGDGIPEVMQGILTNESRISPELTFLKPLSAAIVIGTGGPFGAEGPIIATGGALGSLLGQLVRTTAMERKTLLAAGAAAGIASFFGTPIAAVLMAVELLLFEFRPRSLIPVALASATAMAVRLTMYGSTPIFNLTSISHPGGYALVFYTILGAIVGLGGVYVTHLVYWLEDCFEKLPVHWMWWPAIGALVVGIVGYFMPHTLGAGYENIDQLLSGSMLFWAVVGLGVLKLVSWAIALSSGTSGGTIAPLFTIGGAMGMIVGQAGVALFPGAGIDLRIAALVGMAAIFSGASRAMLTSVVFAFEATLQPLGLLPLLSGCSAAYLISSLLMKNTIMTEKAARHGVHVPTEYSADYLDMIRVKDVYSSPAATIGANQTVEEVQEWLTGKDPQTHHQGFPVVDENSFLLGVVTYRDIMGKSVSEEQKIAQLIKRPPSVIYDDCSLRVAADHMVREDVGRLPVVKRDAPGKIIGILSRGDILSAHGQRLKETHDKIRSIRITKSLRKMTSRGKSK
ncbi:MAG: chloride channel protein [Abditibacteriaceae bacterium]